MKLETSICQDPSAWGWGCSFISLYFCSLPRALIYLEPRWLVLLGLPSRDVSLVYPCHPGLHKQPSWVLLDFPQYLQLNLSPCSTLPSGHSTLKGHQFSQVQRSAVFGFSYLQPSPGASAPPPVVCTPLSLDRHSPVPGFMAWWAEAPLYKSQAAPLHLCLHFCFLENISSTPFQRLSSHPSSLCLNVLPQRGPLWPPILT